VRLDWRRALSGDGGVAATLALVLDRLFLLLEVDDGIFSKKLF